VAAFYPLPRCLFYRVGRFHCSGFIIVFLRLPLGSQLKKVVHWMSEILFATEIAFGRLHGYMPQQELNLLKLSAVRVAQLRTRSPEIMRRNMLQARSLAATLDYVPHDILRDAFSPHLSRSGNCSKDPSLRDLRCYYPLIECRFDPLWNGHRADVAALADQIYHRPVPLAHLDFIQLQAHEFRSAKTTTKQQGQHGVVALRSHAISTTHFRTAELSSALNQFPERNPSCLTPFTRLIPAANSGLSKPESAASCARRRTAASCWLTVFAARLLDSRYMR